MVKSTDSGDSWVLLTPNIFITDNWESAFFINRNIGWIAGGANSIIDKTTDGGINWIRQTDDPTNSVWLYSIFFTDSISGWAVGVGNDSSGLSGEILKTTNGGVTFIENEPETGLSNYKLSQSYTNPFNPTTNIGFRIAEFGFVSLKVYDALGKEIATLVNEEKPIGSYEVEFDGTALSSGIYIYRLTSGNFTTSKKLILLK